MSKTGRTWGFLLMSIPLACSSKSSLKLSGGDGAVSGVDADLGDATVIVADDAKAPVPDVLLPADLAVGPDVVAGTPDAGKDDASFTADAAPDLGRGGDDVGTVPYADGKPFPDGPVFYADGNPPPDGPVFYTDGKAPPDVGPDTAKADAARDVGASGDTGILVSGVVVIRNSDYATADTACLQGTSSWLSSLTTYLPEDRKCWADSDCQYVSFTNSCGQVCPVPMNVQRIGEFSQHAIGDLDSKCATCSLPANAPGCPAPPGDGSVICSAGLCAWK